jgi:hypothetical protein
VTLTRPDIEQLQSAGLLGKGKMVYDIAKQVQMTLGGLVATEKTLSAKPEQTRKLLRALWKGTIYMLTERRGTIAIMEKILPKMSPEALTNDYVGTVEDADKEGVISLDAARRELSVRGELLGVPQDKILPPEKIYDFSLIEGVIKELDTAHWRPTN